MNLDDISNLINASIDFKIKELRETYLSLVNTLGQNDTDRIEWEKQSRKECPTLRDQFAMSCPPIFFNKMSWTSIAKLLEIPEVDEFSNEMFMLAEIKVRYKYADLMLAEREKK